MTIIKDKIIIAPYLTVLILKVSINLCVTSHTRSDYSMTGMGGLPLYLIIINF